MDETDLFLTLEKVKRGADAATQGWNIDVCPYMSDLAIKAWRFGYKMSKLQSAYAQQKLLKQMTVRADFHDEAQAAYNAALTVLQAEIPHELDIVL